MEETKSQIEIESEAYEATLTLSLDARDAAERFDDWVEPMKQAEEVLRNRIETIKEKWKLEFAELINDHDTAKTAADEADKAVRAGVVSFYNLREDKAKKTGFVPGWGVAVSKEYVYDEKEALGWVIEHKHTGLLKLDATKFKQLADTALKPDFVTINDKVIAKIDPKSQIKNGGTVA